jgi:hypothetical protein
MDEEEVAATRRRFDFSEAAMGANEDDDDEEEEVDDEGLFEAFDLAAIAAEAEQKAKDMAVDLAATGVFTTVRKLTHQNR